MDVCLMIEGQEGVSWDQWVALALASECGDSPPPTDSELVGELLYAPVLNCALVLNERVDATFVAAVVDHVLAPILGAAPR